MEAWLAARQRRLNEASCRDAAEAGWISILVAGVLVLQAACKSIGRHAVVALRTGDTPVAPGDLRMGIPPVLVEAVRQTAEANDVPASMLQRPQRDGRHEADLSRSVQAASLPTSGGEVRREEAPLQLRR